MKHSKIQSDKYLCNEFTIFHYSRSDVTMSKFQSMFCSYISTMYNVLRPKCTYIRVGKTGSLGPWSRVIVYCSKLSFCQNDDPMGESFWKKESLLQYTMTLLQGPKDRVLPTLTYILRNLIPPLSCN